MSIGRATFESGWFNWLRRWRYTLSAAVDALLWFAALLVAVLARLDFDPMRIDWAGWLTVSVVAAATQLVVGYLIGLYRGARTIASFEEVLLVVAASFVSGFAAFATVLIVGTPNLVPLSAVIAATAYQLLGALAMRYGVRLWVELLSQSDHDRPTRLIVYGAGDAGQQIIRSLQRDKETDLDPVAILDDDPTKSRLRIQGIRVRGGLDKMTEVAQELDASTVLIAMPSASQADTNRVADAAINAGLAVKIVPSVQDLTSGVIRVSDIRDLTLSDFLDRDEVDIDLESVRGYVEGRRVLVTGAGGSIGAELCATLSRFSPSRLVMLDHDENALHALQLRMEGRALLTSEDLVLCDIRDSDAVTTAFEAVHPQVVFHAAAHKHVTFLGRFPSEAAKTNVDGTRNLLDVSKTVGVETFVNISTDKAADPINVLGKTKRMAELLTAATDDEAEGRYLSVRFGNVLGSNGSVVPTFMHQIEAGEPVTVTHPDATRFFMTIPEAVLLVVQAGALGEGGDVLVLDMGDPVRIVDLATRLSRQMRPGAEPNIEFTGLRDGEKLHEVLSTPRDEALPSPHPRLQRYRVTERRSESTVPA